MEVEYQNTAESLHALRRRVIARERKRLFLLGLMYVALFGVPPSMLFAAFAIWPAVYAGWIIIGIVLLAILLLARKQMSGMMQSFLDRGMPVCKIKITPDVFASEDEWGWSRREWSVIESVTSTADHVFIFVDQATAHVIPFHAFASADDATAFAAQAEAYRKAAEARQTPRFQAPPAPKVMDSEQLQVTYRELPEDKLAVQRDVTEQDDVDLNPPPQNAGKQRGSPIVNCLPLLLIICGFLIFVSLRQFGWLGQFFAGLLVYLLWGMVVLLLDWRVRTIIARRSKHDAPETTVTISRAGLLQTTPQRESFSTWRTWEDVRNTPSYILFCTIKQHVALIVPKRAFETPEQADHFAAVTKRYWEVDAQQARAPVEVVREDEGNPYQSPFGY